MSFYRCLYLVAPGAYLYESVDVPLCKVAALEGSTAALKSELADTSKRKAEAEETADVLQERGRASTFEVLKRVLLC